MIAVNIYVSMVCNHCKNLLEETYRSAILSRVFEYYCIASEVSTNNYKVFSIQVEVVSIHIDTHRLNNKPDLRHSVETKDTQASANRERKRDQVNLHTKFIIREERVYCEAFNAINISRAPQGFALVC